jgi:hypothetical protein
LCNIDPGRIWLDDGHAVAMPDALAESAIERGDEFGAPLPLSTNDIAEKFVQFYWRQAWHHRSR